MKAWGRCRQCDAAFEDHLDFLLHACIETKFTGPLVVKAHGRNAQWDDGTAVMVHVNEKTGEVRYVGSHDAKLKPGYERHFLRSLQEVNKFEREHKVANERMHFDRNGRGLDDTYRGERLTH